MSDSLFDVVGIGNAIVDVICQATHSDIKRLGLNKGSMTLIETEDATRLHSEMTAPIEMSGGSAANTLAGLASLGGKGAFIGKVRNDRFGDVFRHDMASIGIDHRLWPASEGPPTGRCLIFVTPDSDRTMQTLLGASSALGPEDIDPEALGSARITYLEGYLFDLSPAKQAFFKAAELAHAADRKVALSLSDPFCVERHREEFRNLIEAHVDILFGNRDELMFLYPSESFEDAVETIAQKTEIAAITCGPEGSVIVRGADRFDIDAHEVDRVVDTTGAGDLYAAGVLFGLTRGYNPERCGKIGSICAAEVISHFGARPAASLADLVEMSEA